MPETRILARYGPLTVIGGANEGRFPWCNTVVVGGAAVIDPGCGTDALKQVASEIWGGRGPEFVVNTHYHFDHVSGNSLFPAARWLNNPKEAEAFRSRAGLGQLMGAAEVYGADVAAQWLQGAGLLGKPRLGLAPYYRKEWWASTGRVDGVYQVGREFALGGASGRGGTGGGGTGTGGYRSGVKVVMVETPGHTQGFCCPYFPEHGVVCTGDYDLTSFGPWYAGADSDFEAMRRSAGHLLELDARHFVTGHQKGVVDRSQFEAGLRDFLAVIDRRHGEYLRLVREGRDFEAIVAAGVLYPPRFHVDPWIVMWERLSAAKHLRRLADEGWNVPPVEVRAPADEVPPEGD